MTRGTTPSIIYHCSLCGLCFCPCHSFLQSIGPFLCHWSPDSGHGFMETWMSMWEKISPLFFFIKAELFPVCSPPHTCLETVTFYLKGGLEIISALHGIHRLGKWHHPETTFLLLKLPSIYANSQTWCYSYSWYFIIFVSFENTCSPETFIFLVLFIHVQNCSHICIYPTANW